MSTTFDKQSHNDIVNVNLQDDLLICNDHDICNENAAKHTTGNNEEQQLIVCSCLNAKTLQLDCCLQNFLTILYVNGTHK